MIQEIEMIEISNLINLSSYLGLTLSTVHWVERS